MIITRGVADALTIGYQQRPDLFTLRINRPQPFAAKVIEVDERMGPEGQVEIPLNQSALRMDLEKLFSEGFRSLAIVLMHACHNPSHELCIGDLAQEIGFEYVALSHQSDPAPGLIERGQTTYADAYLTPVIRSHLRDFQSQLQGSPLLCLQSNGHLLEPQNFRGQHACAVAEALGLSHVVIPALPGLFSAIGMSQASQGWESAITLSHLPLNDSSLSEAEKLGCNRKRKPDWPCRIKP